VLATALKRGKNTRHRPAPFSKKLRGYGRSGWPSRPLSMLRYLIPRSDALFGVALGVLVFAGLASLFVVIGTIFLYL
jgi:hypothetical protein